MYCQDEQKAIILESYMDYWRCVNSDATKQEQNDKWSEVYKFLIDEGDIYDYDSVYLQWAKRKHQKQMEEDYQREKDKCLDLQKRSSIPRYLTSQKKRSKARAKNKRSRKSRQRNRK